MSPDQIEDLMTLVTRYGDARARQLVPGTDAERDADRRAIEAAEQAIRTMVSPSVPSARPVVRPRIATEANARAAFAAGFLEDDDDEWGTRGGGN